MKKRLFLMISVLLCIMFCFVGCASTSSYLDNKGGDYYEDNPSTEETTGEFKGGSNTTERKIIYTARFSLSCEDLDVTVKLIKSSLNDDEWLDVETIYSSSAYIVARISSDRIDAFVEAVSKDSTLVKYSKTAIDVSLDYANKQLSLDALNAEHARLIKLLDEATSLADTLAINSRLTTIEAEISQLTKQLNYYDSRIDFSEVTIHLNQAYVVQKEGFGSRIVTVFKGAIKALGTFFKFLLLAIIAISPFAAIAVPLFFLVAFLVKKYRIRVAQKLAEKKSKEKEEKENP